MPFGALIIMQVKPCDKEEKRSKQKSQYIFRILSSGGDQVNNPEIKSRENKYSRFLELSKTEAILQHTGIIFNVENPEIIRINSSYEPIHIELSIKNTENTGLTILDEITILDRSGIVLKTKKINKRLEKCRKRSYSVRLIARILKLISSNKILKAIDVKYSTLIIKILRSMLITVSKYRTDAKECLLKIKVDLKTRDLNKTELNTGDCLKIPVQVKIICDEKDITLKRDYIVYLGSSLVVNDCLDKTWYPGDQHVHSNHSWDGNNTIAEMADKARKIGFSYLIITDHSHSIIDDWDEIKEECMQNTDGKFACIRGLEISCDAFNRSEGGHDFDSSHLLAYKISNLITSKGPIHDVWPDTPDPEDAVDMVHKQEGGFCFSAHPSGTKVMGYKWNEWENTPDGMSVWTYVHDGDKRPREETLRRWQKLLKESKVIYGSGDSDAHSIEELGHVWTWLLSDSLEPEKIQDALANGKSIFSNGPFSAFYMHDGVKWHSIGSSISITSDGKAKLLVNWESHEEFGMLEKIDIIINEETAYSLYPDERNGYKGWELLEVTVMLSMDAIWRMEARTKTGKLCYSNPIWMRMN